MQVYLCYILLYFKIMGVIIVMTEDFNDFRYHMTIVFCFFLKIKFGEKKYSNENAMKGVCPMSIFEP